ncbi:hypothetical protein PPACK8108_LOCUS2129 [Phakopsora pachyrhizi]|uniref:Uncharacterized protein n=1 Tax=Phakopsora pachyrhizi TaxID=170000 RepID=A0AAV0AHP1_PHAPC|nr:hypothetical protein PPACK8108_LOCUS2129 [Phakopsora pachyrhizi]
MIQLQHPNGPAPSYVIESDSKDDEWVNNLNDSHRNQRQDDLSKRSLSWEPRIPSPKRLGKVLDLTVLVGDAGRLVANGSEDQDIFRNGSLLRLEKRITLSESGCTLLALRLLSDLKPGRLSIVLSYSAPNYVSSSENQLLRYVSYSPDCSCLQVLNLIHGFKAALITTEGLLIVLQAFDIYRKKKNKE